MADGRTRMCGRLDESILRRSRGRRPYCFERHGQQDGHAEPGAVRIAYLGNQLALFELTIYHDNLSISVHLCTPQPRIQRRFRCQRPPLKDGPGLLFQPNSDVAILQRVALFLRVRTKEPLLPHRLAPILPGRLVRRSIPLRSPNTTMLTRLLARRGALLRQRLGEDCIEAEKSSLQRGLAAGCRDAQRQRLGRPYPRAGADVAAVRQARGAIGEPEAFRLGA